MKDLNINIGGPRNRAKQQVSFKIVQTGDRPGFDAGEIGQLIGQLRTALEQSTLQSDELRRAQRQLAAIEDEVASEQPAICEIGNAISFLGGLVQSAQGMAPIFSSTLQMLAAAVGIVPVRG